MNSSSVLIVEDEKKISLLLKDYFENAQFKVFTLERGDEVLSFLERISVDLVLLDIMLPGMDGREVLRQIRRNSSLPVIMLTARIEETDVISGLQLGADDYICKPFSPKEVVARVQTVLRRSRPDSFFREIRINSLCLNLESHEVNIRDHKVLVTPNEYGILKTLMMEPDRAFSRKALVSLVQGYRFDGYNRTIDTHIKNLRKKITRYLPGEKVILSVYGKGYKINPDIP